MYGAGVTGETVDRARLLAAKRPKVVGEKKRILKGGAAKVTGKKLRAKGARRIIATV